MEEDGLALQPMPTIHFFPVSSCYSSPRSDPAVATTNSSKKSSPFVVVAAAVASDIEKYNEAFLGRPNEAYIVLGFWTLRSGEAHERFPHLFGQVKLEDFMPWSQLFF